MNMNARKKRKSLKHTRGWYVVTIILAVVFLYSGANFGKGLLKIWRLSSLKRQEQRAIKKSQGEIGNLENEITKLKSDSVYIEEIARREYGMVKKGEEVFRITLPDTVDKRNKSGR